jgi:hypothetical protein
MLIFENLQISVTRSIWHSIAGDCKTEVLPYSSYSPYRQALLDAVLNILPVALLGVAVFRAASGAPLAERVKRPNAWGWADCAAGLH